MDNFVHFTVVEAKYKNTYKCKRSTIVDELVNSLETLLGVFGVGIS